MTTILFWPEKFRRQYRRSPRLSLGAAPVHLVFEFAPTKISIIKTDENHSDDWMEFEFGPPDPSITPFR
jgi:hypothetical protein